MALANITGMYKPDKEDAKYVASGKTREAVTIPAGSRLFMFKNTKRESDKHPHWNLAFAPPDENYQKPTPSAPTQPENDDLPF